MAYQLALIAAEQVFRTAAALDLEASLVDSGLSPMAALSSMTVA